MVMTSDLCEGAKNAEDLYHFPSRKSVHAPNYVSSEKRLRFHNVMKKNIIITGILFLSIIFLMSATTTYAQNITTTIETIDVESVKTHLDEAKSV